MAAAEQLDSIVEYEIRYFEQGKIHSMRVVAEDKKAAHHYYLECGKYNSDLYSIRPDK
ncbi:RNA helicase [Vibrio jasicida]|uniref:RNA helicase n=1 Tax=Vibrio jasicida TaxID=766224 RepID=UPI00148CA31E|nr:RNA helicase [Vibrio jasicida]NOJ19101.1 RNA helicase [Vibrio jasicida]